MSRSWSGGTGRGWRALRARILRANLAAHGGSCQLNVGAHCPRHDRPCTDVCTGVATTVHHVRGKAAGDDPRYLIACCAACNAHVGDPGTYDPRPRPVSNW